jgi:glycosyltransferase involved in cell wall biosynthesis
MRLLIITQAVDLDDPVLGFFHGWIQEFSTRFEIIHIVCLRAGRHDLPENVTVHSLGKETGPSRLKYILLFYRYIWSLRKEYDAVFVHMNEEYVLLGGKIWWLMGKRVVLWRNHKKGSLLTRVACMLARTVCYTSPEAFVAHYKNAVRMPIGIDTAQFAFAGARSDERSILFLGRLDEVKRPDIFIDALFLLKEQNLTFHADIYGSPTDAKSAYAEDLRTHAQPLIEAGLVTFHPGITHDKTPALYGSHAIYVNLTPSGSFDKTIGEALASGCITVTGNAAVKDIVGNLFVVQLNAQVTAQAIGQTLALSAPERENLRQSGREYVENEHSLTLLVEKLGSLYR